MPSPFPGMDPYLENPITWPDLQGSLIVGFRRALNPILRPNYVAHIEERVYISDEDDPGHKILVPDIQVVESGVGGKRRTSVPATAGGGEMAEPITATTLFENEFRELRIAITDVSSHEIVTIIEVLSPTNKCPGSVGRVLYMKKRREILSSPTHLVEIDLLRGGTPVFARSALPPHQYSVHVSRAEDRPDGKLWPILLRQRLPIIDIPLKPGDADAKLDLQAVLTAEYDAGSYDLVIDYDVAPVPPLAGEWAEWEAKVVAATSE
jgi:Protein of unknown function (DUF4058)